mmetsp:Transcript_109207/g.189501  ORF Transcript_109207/g.189501 Transcript_109207/m.189501 type:complete len:226 (+) Transcript_109207:76-753(+)
MPDQSTQEALPISQHCNSYDGEVSKPGSQEAVYTNLTPWVTKMFFVHTYYAYIFVFYLFLLMFYKGYALEYPDWRRPEEMVMIMIIPALQHIRFYFGYWGCEIGSARELCIFLFFCTVLSWVLMYFLFKQAYILPLDAMLSLIAIVIVIIEGFCGLVNILQTIKIKTQSSAFTCLVVVNIFCFLGTVIVFAIYQISPNLAMEEVRTLPRDYQVEQAIRNSVGGGH